MNQDFLIVIFISPKKNQRSCIASLLELKVDENIALQSETNKVSTDKLFCRHEIIIPLNLSELRKQKVTRILLRKILLTIVIHCILTFLSGSLKMKRMQNATSQNKVALFTFKIQHKLLPKYWDCVVRLPSLNYSKKNVYFTCPNIRQLLEEDLFGQRAQDMEQIASVPQRRGKFGYFEKKLLKRSCTVVLIDKFSTSECEEV